MENLYKVRFVVLWLIGAAAFIVYRTMAVRDDAVNASLLTSEEFRNYLLVFILFAVLSLVLKGKLNRKTNIIAGICVGIVQVIVFADGITGYPSAVFNYITVFSILVMIAIVWFAYKWPKVM